MTKSSASPTTIYFGYGSNLWLEQMHIRCPNSQYMGVARLDDYQWIINDRGYANVVQVSTGSGSGYKNVVFGLVYSLTAADEARLDKNEGVPVAYTKERLSCDFWSSDGSHKKVDTYQPPEKSIDMLVYIDRKRVTPDAPRKEYIYRMNRGIEDGVKMGVPEKYIREVMRKFIPEDTEQEENKEEERSLKELAKAQATQFTDESGVF